MVRIMTKVGACLPIQWTEAEHGKPQRAENVKQNIAGIIKI